MKKVLLMKLRHHGDVLLTTPLVASIRFFFPQAEIDFLVYEESRDLVAYHPDVNEVLVVSREWKKTRWLRFKKEFELILKIRRNKYDHVFHLTEGDRGAFYARFSGANIRVGLDPSGSGFKGKRGWFTHLVQSQGLIKHTVEHHLDFIRILGYFPPESIRRVGLYYQEQHRKKIELFCSKPYLVVHPGSRWMFKALPVETMLFVIRQILEEKKLQVVITGSSDPQEKQYIKKLKEGLAAYTGWIDLSGKLSLLELAACLDLSAAVLTVDSLPMHIAASYQKRLVVAFGPTSSVKWGPWKNPNAIVVQLGLPCQPCYRAGCCDQGRSDCLESLPPSYLLKALQKCLKTTKGDFSLF